MHEPHQVDNVKSLLVRLWTLLLGESGKSPGGSQAVGSKDLPADLFQHRARGIRYRRLSPLTAAPRLRWRAAHEVGQVGTQFPIVESVLYDVDGQGYDGGPGELPPDLARPAGAQPIALASWTVRHRLVRPARTGRCPRGFTIRAGE